MRKTNQIFIFKGDAVMKLYKLTDENGVTRGDTKWGEGVEHRVPPVENPRLCTEDVIHAYQNANLAYFLNPIHANFRNPILWEAEGDVVVEDWGKVGCFNLRTIKQLDAPRWIGGSKEKLVCVAFTVLCAEAVLYIYEKRYPGCDAPRKAINAAREYIKNQNSAAADTVRAAADATAYAAAHAAVAAAVAAADAARAAADAARAATTSAAAYTVLYTAYAAYAAADAADADAQRNGVNTIDFGTLADEAVEISVNTQKQERVSEHNI